MPTYDYRCTACSHEFELFQSMKDSPKRKCPACSKNALERLIGTGAAVLFKGSGFYETDYRSKSYTEAAKKEKEAATPSGNGTGSGPATSEPEKTAAEPKPAKKKEAAASKAKD